MNGYGNRVRLGAIALGVAGLLFVLYPAVRPWKDESTAEGAQAAMSSAAWVAAHLFAIIGFILVPLGLLAVWAVLARSAVERLAFGAVVITWIGVGLTLPYYGAEDFALNAIASKAKQGQNLDLLDLVDAIRYHPVGGTMFILGLLALGAGAVLAATCVWRSGTLPRYSGVPMAVGFALFIPQFFAPGGIRIAHGVLLGAGLVWLALVLWRVEAHT